MNRRKKSALFSVSIASVGLVAGSLLVLSNNTRAEQLEFSAMSLSEASEILSKELKISKESVSEALATKQIIAKISDESILENDPTIVKYDRVLNGYYIIEYRTASEAATGYKELKDNDQAKNVILNQTLEVSATSVSSENLAWGVNTMKLNEYASDLSSKNNIVTVAVLDTGIRADHEAFTENSLKDRLSMDLAYDFYNNDESPDDDYGHGTMVAGVIAESTPNNVKIIPIKVGGGDNGSVPATSFVYGLDRVAGKVDIINMSFGWEQKDVSADFMAGVDDVMNQVKELGTISVAAAGNEKASTIDYPAAAPAVISATSVGQANTFSTRFSNHGSRADFAAPGESLILPDFNGTNTYVSANGTSFSSPFVAAAIANILVENPSYTQEQVYDYLKLNAEDLGEAGWDEYYGWGSLSFHVNRYADLTISNIVVPNDWVNEDVEISLNASSSAYNINKGVLGSGNVLTTPTAWTDITTPAKTLSETITISENGTYTVWLKNSNNETASKSFEVSKIDKDAPVIQTALKASDITEDSFKLSIAVIENGSGVKKIEWKYKLDEDDEYTTVTDDFSSSAGSASVLSTTKSHVFTDVESGEYNAYAVIYDYAGNSVTGEKLNFTISEEGGEFGGETLVDETQQPTATQTGATTNPKTDSQSVLPVSLAGGAFVLLGAAVAIRRRR